MYSPTEHSHTTKAQALNIEKDQVRIDFEREAAEREGALRERAEYAETKIAQMQQENNSALMDCRRYREELFRFRPDV